MSKIYSKGPVNTVIRIRQISKIREKNGVFFELRVPFLDIERDQLVVFVGPSGCGKSTLLDMLGLILCPTNGTEFSFRVDGRKEDRIHINSLSDNQLAFIRKTYIGYVLQTGGLLPFLSVKENILLPCRINRLKGQEARVLEIARYLGIHDQLPKKPKYLSGGQRQRAAIARALAHHPPIVLADEPTAAVDRLSAVDILKKFKEITSQMGVTLIMVTHDQTLASDEADKIFVFQVQKKDDNHICSTLVERSNA